MDMPPVEEGDPELVAFWLRFFRRLIAALQIIGGLYGLYSVVFGSLIGTSRIVFLMAFVLFAASVWGGVLLALNKPGGVAASLIIQTLQVLQIATESFAYSFVCGVQLVLGLRPMEDGPEVGFSFFSPSRFLAFINPPSALSQIGFTGVNIVAVAAIICLLYVRSARTHVPLSRLELELPVENAWPPAPEP